MSIVSNASPMIVLAKAGLLDLLPKLFTEVVIPQAVRNEIESGPVDDPARLALPACGWLRVATLEPVLSPLAVMQLGRGEAEVIYLVRCMNVWRCELTNGRSAWLRLGLSLLWSVPLLAVVLLFEQRQAVVILGCAYVYLSLAEFFIDQWRLKAVGLTKGAIRRRRVLAVIPVLLFLPLGFYWIV